MRVEQLRAKRAVALQNELHRARAFRKVVAFAVRQWRGYSRRITRAADRLNQTLEDPIVVDMPTPAELLGALEPTIDGPATAFAELRSMAKEIARMPRARARKAAAEIAKFGGHYESIQKALKNPEALAFRHEAQNELRRLEGKAPLSLAEYRSSLQVQADRFESLKRKAKGGRSR